MALKLAAHPCHRRGLATLVKVAAALFACGAPCAATRGAHLGRTYRHSVGDHRHARSDCSYQSVYPRQYVAYKTTALAPEALDGDLSKQVWAEVDWTADFVDITTTTRPKFRTRAKMRWDDSFLYVAAELEEPDIWATLHKKNSVIYHDNDFEVFVDPNATTHYYKEFEMNAFNTTWDLCLNKPYADGGYENSSRVYGARGFSVTPPTRCAVNIAPPTALNNPEVRGLGWFVEIALPLQQLAYNNTDVMPSEGTFWRVDFSRVEWGVTVNKTTGERKKAPSCQSCADPGAAAEDNWVWSPQGEVAMHLPERWGILQFAEGAPGSTAPKHYAEWSARSAAMAIYYAQHAYKKDHDGDFADSVDKLLDYSAPPFEICSQASTQITVGDRTFMATVAPYGEDFAATVRSDRFLTVAPWSVK
mmetsp:Transcript_91591/g.236428  ORF Transcript_91591/g.236428 Transcript_91591/m.236428 type:complete len:418 (-) Transcript_91591:105-1358(-)|eukprot:CAMPEP_0195129804 /NCGR_PEP_ID=MMETSP0448-20130528/141981_1 /TAXON_ID=66468 /ORGANISM="Heterocapsa triquestra, Strain CCMP 448" /LENGTH=417 /DNA_ID=CAMNT_0040167673 /DNA_START=13 /DNA_END=1266 /DNA_ORIENTATION=-